MAKRRSAIPTRPEGFFADLFGGGRAFDIEQADLVQKQVTTQVKRQESLRKGLADIAGLGLDPNESAQRFNDLQAQFGVSNKVDASKFFESIQKPTRKEVLTRKRPKPGVTVKTKTRGGEEITRKGPTEKRDVVNTPAFFESEFGFDPNKAQEAAEVARGVRPKTLESFSILELTTIADRLQLSGSPAGFQTAEKIFGFAEDRAKQDLTRIQERRTQVKEAAQEKKLTKEEAQTILEEAGGDKSRARELAKERGFTF